MIKLLSVISVTLIIVNSVLSVQIGYDTFKKLQPCQDQCMKLYSVQKANPDTTQAPELTGCNSGCNLLVQSTGLTQADCAKSCTLFTQSKSGIAACIRSCTNFADLSKPAIEQPIVTEIKKIDDMKIIENLKDIVPAIPVKKDPLPLDTIKIEEEDDSSESDSSEEKSDNSSSTNNKKKDSSSSEEDVKEVESPFEVFRHFFGSSLIGGEPGILNNKPEESQNNPTDNKIDDLQDLVNIDDQKFDESNNAFDTLFNYFDKFKDSLKSAYDKGSYILRVRIFPNGTVLKSYNELPSDGSPISLFDNEPPRQLEPSDMKQVNLHSQFGGNGEGINWKGIPLAIGKPIIEPYQPNEEPPMYFRYRECKPIGFHLSTLCHDINNLFTCASMRTGLPRWFFLSAVLLTSFLMIWLGLFILSTLRRLRKRERVIHYHEEYLPLYKDIDYDIEKSEINNAYEAGPLPIKVKSDIV